MASYIVGRWKPVMLTVAIFTKGASSRGVTQFSSVVIYVAGETVVGPEARVGIPRRIPDERYVDLIIPACRPRMTSFATDFGMCTDERKSRSLVIESGSRKVFAQPAPVCRCVTGSTVCAKRSFVNILVARSAGSEFEVGILDILGAGRGAHCWMAALARDVQVFADELKWGVVVIEDGGLFPGIFRVAMAALCPLELILVGRFGGMASDTGSPQAQKRFFERAMRLLERTDIGRDDVRWCVTASTRRLIVSAKKLKSCIIVIKLHRVQADENEVDAKMLFMAVRAVLIRYRTVITPPGFDPI